MSQIATTIEQSKRLLDAGLDPGSADMRWETFPVCVPHLCYQTNAIPLIAPKIVPAWSLSRLIDIHRNFDYGPMDDGSAAVIDCLVRAICYEIKYETGRVREEFIVKRPLGQPQETEGA